MYNDNEKANSIRLFSKAKKYLWDTYPGLKKFLSFKINTARSTMILLSTPLAKQVAISDRYGHEKVLLLYPTETV